MKKISLLLLTFLLVGCIGGPAKVDPTRGVTINSFVATPSTVFSGEQVLFEGEIENIGGTDATNVQVDFFGVEEQWRDSTGSLVGSTLTKNIGTLRAPDPVRNAPGVPRAIQQILITPQVGQGLVVPVGVVMQATYDYNTNGFIDIPAISEDEFRRMQINKQKIDLPVTVQNSAGPIHMSMDQKYIPIRVDTTDENEDFTTWTLRIVFTNVGDGFPITPEDDVRVRGAGGKITGSIELFGPGASFEDCLGETDGTHIDLDSSEIALRIREDGNAYMPCTIKIDNNIWKSNNRPLETIKMAFDLNYRYYVRQTATVTVSGRNE